VQVEVFSWWTAPGEAEALQALVDLHKTKFPSETIYNAATDPKVISGGVEAKAVLKMRIDAGNPPDAFQTNAYELTTFKSDLLEPLDDLFAAQGLSTTIAPEILHDVTVGGHVLGVPVNVHRANGLFYNKTVFKQNNLQPPTTIDEFLTVCDKLKKAGVTPLALSTSQGWIMDLVFASFTLGKLGPDGYIKYYVNKTPVDPTVFQPVVDLMDQVVTDYIDVTAAADPMFGWTQAADAMKAGTSAMFMHGDWAKGYLVQQYGWTPNVDFGVVASPDSGGTFIYGSDVFSVPAGAKHLDGGKDWMTTIASPEGQVAFNELKGSSPVRLNVPTTGLDPMAVEIYGDFTNAKHRVAQVSLPAAWDTALVQLAVDHDKAAFMKVLVDNPVGG